MKAKRFVMKWIAAPIICGIFTSLIMELLVYPAIYELWRWHFYVKKSSQEKLVSLWTRIINFQLSVMLHTF